MRSKGWGTWSLFAVLALVGLMGCATRRGGAAEETAGEAPLAVRSRNLIAQGRYVEARRELEARDDLSARESILLAEACLGTGDLETASGLFYDVRTRGDLSPELEFRALAGLGDIDLLRRDGMAASQHFRSALERAVDRASRDRALVGAARGELMAGRPEEARRLRSRVSMTGVAGLSTLDGELAAGRTRRKGTVATGPAPRRRTPKRSRKAVVPPGPPILSRNAWRARPVIRSRVEPMQHVSRITIHHSGETTRTTLSSREQVAARLRSYQSAHRARGWADIGYHFAVDAAGRIWEGRRLVWQGAHAGSPEANARNVGIVVIGNYQSHGLNPRQRRALKDLVTWISRRYGIPPTRIYTHQEIKKRLGLPGTACPGRRLAAFVRGLRASLAKERRGVARAAASSSHAGGRHGTAPSTPSSGGQLR